MNSTCLGLFSLSFAWQTHSHPQLRQRISHSSATSETSLVETEQFVDENDEDVHEDAMAIAFVSFSLFKHFYRAIHVKVRFEQGCQREPNRVSSAQVSSRLCARVHSPLGCS
jgi:hypothetical protein